MKKAVRASLVYLTVAVGSFVFTRIALGVRKAANHPNPEMWE